MRHRCGHLRHSRCPAPTAPSMRTWARAWAPPGRAREVQASCATTTACKRHCRACASSGAGRRRSSSRCPSGGRVAHSRSQSRTRGRRGRVRHSSTARSRRGSDGRRSGRKSSNRRRSEVPRAAVARAAAAAARAVASRLRRQSHTRPPARYPRSTFALRRPDGQHHRLLSAHSSHRREHRRRWCRRHEGDPRRRVASHRPPRWRPPHRPDRRTRLGCRRLHPNHSRRAPE